MRQRLVAWLVKYRGDDFENPTLRRFQRTVFYTILTVNVVVIVLTAIILVW